MFLGAPMLAKKINDFKCRESRNIINTSVFAITMAVSSPQLTGSRWMLTINETFIVVFCSNNALDFDCSAGHRHPIGWPSLASRPPLNATRLNVRWLNIMTDVTVPSPNDQVVNILSVKR